MALATDESIAASNSHATEMKRGHGGGDVDEKVQ